MTLWTSVNKNNEIHKRKKKHKLERDKSDLSLFLNEHMDMSNIPLLGYSSLEFLWVWMSF